MENGNCSDSYKLRDLEPEHDSSDMSNFLMILSLAFVIKRFLDDVIGTDI